MFSQLDKQNVPIGRVFAVALLGMLIHPMESEAGFLPSIGESADYTHVKQKFRSVKERFSLETTSRAGGASCRDGDVISCGYQRFNDKLGELRQYQGLRLLQMVNRSFNEVPYHLDEKVYRDPDYWATPYEFLGHNAGDCEDYALAKFLALEEMGWPTDEMKVIVLWDERARLHHAVLLVRHAGQEWILDNASNSLRRSHHVEHYTPLYAVNDTVSLYYHNVYAAKDETPKESRTSSGVPEKAPQRRFY